MHCGRPAAIFSVRRRLSAASYVVQSLLLHAPHSPCLCIAAAAYRLAGILCERRQFSLSLCVFVSVAHITHTPSNRLPLLRLAGEAGVAAARVAATLDACLVFPNFIFALHSFIKLHT